MYGCERWTVKKAERRRIDAFELWCWRRLFRVPWTARRSNQPILKEISPGISLEGLMLKLKLQYFGHLMRRVDSLEKTLMLGGIGGRRRRGRQMAGWHHRLNGHEFGWTPGVCDGQGGLAYCSSWGRKESDMTEQLNWTEEVGWSWSLPLKVFVKTLSVQDSQTLDILPSVKPCSHRQPLPPQDSLDPGLFMSLTQTFSHSFIQANTQLFLNTYSLLQEGSWIRMTFMNFSPILATSDYTYIQLHHLIRLSLVTEACNNSWCFKVEGHIVSLHVPHYTPLYPIIPCIVLAP